MDAAGSGPSPFLEAERDPPELISQQRTRVEQTQGLGLFEDFPVAVFILNPRRQIIYLNRKALGLLPDPASDPRGLRPGEAFACVNAADGPGGCGTGRYCRYCGAARSIASALSGTLDAQECHVERTVHTKSEQLDILVWTKPLPVDGRAFLLSAMMDISAEERRETFERIFLHDIMNTASSLASLLRLLDASDPSFDEYLDLAMVAADQLTDEILSHRMLADAERGVLFLRKETVSPADLVSTLATTYRHIAQSRGLVLAVEAPPGGAIETDPVLLKRVVANLLKNAVEASRRGDRIDLSCSRLPTGETEIRLRNPALMSEEILANLFKRSFSTKGKGRGLGTYAARLFVEDYLGGRVGCTSREGEGTVFTILLPERPPDQASERSLIR